jgi:hypothetical protein
MLNGEHLCHLLTSSASKSSSAGLANCTFFVGTDQTPELTDDQQNQKQCCDQNDVRRSVHVVEEAIEFIHVSAPGWAKIWDHFGTVPPKLK